MADSKQFHISIEYLLLLMVLALAYIGTRIFPEFSILFVFLSASVIAAIGMRFSVIMCASASAALLLANGIVSFISGEGIAGCVAIPVLVPAISGFLCAYCLRSHYGLLKTTVISSLGALLSIGIFGFTITRFVDPNFFTQIFDALKATVYDLVALFA